MALTDEVRTNCAAIARNACWVTIETDRLGDIEPGPPPALDPERHYLEGTPEEVADYLLTLNAINFGSGWFPTLNKRPGSSGYFTIAWALADRFRAHGPYDNNELRGMSADDLADTLGQPRGHELMQLYADALRQLGDFLGDRRAIDLIGDSAVGLATELTQMPFFDDTGFYKRAQIVPNDFTLAGLATFADIDELTIFADNLVPHVLRVDGVLTYHPDLAHQIDSEQLLPPGEAEREIRACAVHACVQIAAQLVIPERDLDVMLWNRGQAPHYKSRPRHRTRTVYY